MKHSILRRFSATLFANGLGAAAAFAASMLLARGLGSAKYGDFNFLLASFAALQTGLDMGSSTAFYTFLAKGRGGLGHVRAYAGWLAARFALIALAVGLLLPGSWIAKLWFHPRPLVLLAFCGFFFSVPLRTFLVQLAESIRESVLVQTAIAALAVFHLASVTALLVTHTLSVPVLFILLVAEYALLGLFVRWKLNWSAFKDAGAVTLRDYGRYCAPLIAYSWLGFTCEFADRWLLQRFGGSAQQGFFSISQQFAGIALLATASLLNIFWKEIADAHHRGDQARARELYRNSCRALFFITAGAACFLVPHAKTLLVTLAGPSFETAWPALALMLLFPVFQTIGQLNGAFFLATEDTRTHVAIGSAGLLVGLPLTYLVLAPRSALVPGLDLGAAGLAARWSLLQVAMVGVQSWVVARRQDAGSEMGRHLAVLAGMLAVAWAARLAAGWAAAILPGPTRFWTLALAAPLYAAALAAFALARPEAAGTSRAQLARIAEALRLS
ncbi:MAG: lipopolysaccharide biosynthesis protein [Elusimicrobia bacterium]|nr:lipopolysaccharide biosynthesis protein [Elusimicrobiota bacterium]